MLFVAPAQLAQAASLYAPGLVYRTVHTPRFAVHYPPGAYNLAVRMGRLAEQCLEADAERLGFMPRGKIEVVLSDTQDDANGLATVLPKNTLRLYLAAPTQMNGLSSYEDWLSMLLSHELAHIVDIDHTAGFTRALRHVFGKVIAYNGSMPQYLSEGVAVWAETKNTPTGRGRSPYVDMVLRTAALEDNFVHIDQAHGLFARYPYGNAAYFYGGRFHLYLSERLGDSAVRQLHAYYASQLVPLIYDPGAKEIFGQSLPKLWQDFAQHEQDLAKEVAQRLYREGITVGDTLVRHAGDIMAACYDQTGQVLYSRRSPWDGATVRRSLALPGQKNTHRKDVRLFRDTFNTRLALDPHGTDFIYSMASISHRFDSWSDIYLYDAKRAQGIRLYDARRPHQVLRAREPSMRPDGKVLVFVQAALHQTWLTKAELTRDQDGRLLPAMRLTVLVPPKGDMQHATPAFSPDGTLLAESVWFAGGARDILLVDPNTGAWVQRLTQDNAQDGNPAWSPDGRYLLWESDRDGIANIYAYDRKLCTYARVTRVWGGAFQPSVSPDGKKLLFRHARGDGYEIKEIAFNPARWQPMVYQDGAMTAVSKVVAAGHSAPARWPASAPLPLPEAVAAGQSRAEEPPLLLQEGEREGPYRPLRTLLPFQDNWLLIPALYLLNNDWGLSLNTQGEDSLARHSWSLTLGTTLHAHRPNVSVSYVNNQLLPTFTLSLSQVANPYRTTLGWAVQQSRLAGLSMAWFFARRHTIGLGYSFEQRKNDTRLANLLPDGRFGQLRLSYSYSFGRSFPYSISTELGQVFTLSAASYNRVFGGQRDQIVVSGDVRNYANNPLWHNHVLAMRFRASYSFGHDNTQSFFLYGTQGSSVLSVQSSNLLPLRGFAPGRRGLGTPAPGAAVASGIVEYRLPVWHIQRGLWTLPVYFEHLHLGFFADVGNTFGTQYVAQKGDPQLNFVTAMRSLWISFGAETRLDVALGWQIPLTVRFGVAQPAQARGRRVIDKVRPQVYLDVGTLL